jgi:hypothetical protein
LKMYTVELPETEQEFVVWALENASNTQSVVRIEEIAIQNGSTISAQTKMDVTECMRDYYLNWVRRIVVELPSVKVVKEVTRRNTVFNLGTGGRVLTIHVAGVRVL